MPNDVEAIASQMPEVGPPLWSNEFWLLWHKYLDRDGSVRITDRWEEEAEAMLPAVYPTQTSPEYRKIDLKCERVIFSLPPGYVLGKRGAQEFVQKMKGANYEDGSAAVWDEIVAQAENFTLEDATIVPINDGRTLQVEYCFEEERW